MDKNDNNNYNNYNNNDYNNGYKNQSYYLPDDDYYYGRKKKKKGFKGSFISYLLVIIIASTIGGMVSPYVAERLYDRVLPHPTYQYQNESPITINALDDMNTVSAVVKKSMSSVVGITTIEEVQQYWFAPQLVEGLGSGIIVDSNGYILTNSHVVAGGNARSVTVLFENGDKLPANVLWADPNMDLAIVKVNASNLPVADLGDSDEIQVGEIAVAIGNPLGLEYQRSVTAGIISGLHRSVQVSQTSIIEDLIQTDASINPGNSGGPLLNAKGQVIGINTAKIKSGEGLGFSIPINEAKQAISEVINNGSYQQVFMGISGLSVEEYEERLGIGLPIDKGLVILQVSPNTPAHQAGILSGDILIKMDNNSIDNMTQLKKVLYNYKLGNRAKLVVYRVDREVELEIEFTQTR